MADSKTTLRFMNDDDGPGINRLFLSVFGVSRTIDQWRWKYFDNPHGKALVLVAEADGNIVGHYGLIPRCIKYHGEECIAFQEVDVMIQHEYARGGLFRKMGVAVYSEAQHRGAVFTFGFPNQTSLPVGSRLLRWRAIGAIPLFTLVLKPSRVMARHGKIGEMLQSVGVVADRLWEAYQSMRQKVRGFSGTSWRVDDSFASEFVPESVSHRSDFCFSRDLDYFRWRYRNTGASSYHTIRTQDKSDHAPFLILAITKSNEAFVMEAESRGDSEEMEKLLFAAVAECLKRGIHTLRAWALAGSDESRTYSRFGFLKRDSQLFHVIHSFQSPEYNRYLWDTSRWYISAGDSDCF